MRRSPRYRARFAATVQAPGFSQVIVCHTRNISVDGCFLDTRAPILAGSTIQVTVQDNRQQVSVHLQARVTRSTTDGSGVGIHLQNPPAEWMQMVEHYRTRSETD